MVWAFRESRVSSSGIRTQRRPVPLRRGRAPRGRAPATVRRAAAGSGKGPSWEGLTQPRSTGVSRPSPWPASPLPARVQSVSRTLNRETCHEPLGGKLSPRSGVRGRPGAAACPWLSAARDAAGCALQPSDAGRAAGHAEGAGGAGCTLGSDSASGFGQPRRAGARPAQQRESPAGTRSGGCTPSGCGSGEVGGPALAEARARRGRGVLGRGLRGPGSGQQGRELGRGWARRPDAGKMRAPVGAGGRAVLRCRGRCDRTGRGTVRPACSASTGSRGDRLSGCWALALDPGQDHSTHFLRPRCV